MLCQNVLVGPNKQRVKQTKRQTDLDVESTSLFFGWGQLKKSLFKFLGIKSKQFTFIGMQKVQFSD